MVAGFLLFLQWGIRRILAEEKVRSRSPFSEKLKRPAGETLRLEVERLRDDIGETGLLLTLAVMGPAVLIMLIPIRSPAVQWTIHGMILLLAFSAATRQWLTLRAMRETLRNVRLGYDGERYVGEELNGLMTRGYRVFHDFQVDWLPGGKVFNIDHIALGPEGVFAIETKAKRKPNHEPSKSQRRHEVIFNGRTLKFPQWESDEAVRQAAANAELLSRWLTGTAVESVEVVPVLVIPGWWVERKGKGQVKVFSGKEVAANLPANGKVSALSAEKIQRLGDRIEAHCRNVEGV
jgi:hypothetical protein